MLHSRSLTREEQAHFDRCLKYTYRVLAMYEVFYMYAVYKSLIYPEVSDLPAYGYTDGTNVAMLYPALLEVNEAEFAGIILHEYTHIFNLHVIRKKDRNHKLWNIACDISINHTISTDSNLRYKGTIALRKDMIYSPTVAHLSAEEIYDKLIHNEVPNIRVKNPDRDDMVIEILTPSNKWKVLEFFPDFKVVEGEGDLHKQMLRESRAVYGGIPANLDRGVVDILDKSTVDWRRELRKYVTKNMADYSFSVRDRRFTSESFFVPGMETTPDGALKIKVGIDLSGSVTDTDVVKILTECIAIERQFNCVQFEFVPFDVITYGNFKAKNKDEILKAFSSFKGGGGTSFVKVLEELDTKDAILIIMFTDLYGRFPSKKPKADVIWVDIGNYTGEVPFGRKIDFQ